MWQKKKKKKRRKRQQTDTSRLPCPGSWVAALAPATDGNAGGQAPQRQRGAEKHHPGRAAHERQAGQSPLPAPQGLPQRVRWHFYIHTSLSLSQGLGTGAHSRKHIVVSPRARGPRARLCPGGQNKGERAGGQSDAGHRTTGDTWILTLSAQAGSPSRPLHAASLAQASTGGTPTGFPRLTPWRGGWIPFSTSSLPTLASEG